MVMDIDQMRREYLHGGLTRESLKDNPVDQFQFWLQQAVDGKVQDPTAMSIATVSADGQPSQRIVLLKGCDERGFVFYTNHGSRKAQDIKGNNKVSLNFAWLELDRQVKISGTAVKVSASETLKYFLSRPKDSQLAAWASKQSHPISSRDFMEQEFERMKEKFSKGDIPLPDFWGGYCVKPHRIEFWQGGAMRLHDRFQFSLQDDQSWLVERLAS
jgi:pyridoxamine 5'-phosphate oxidase